MEENKQPSILELFKKIEESNNRVGQELHQFNQSHALILEKLQEKKDSLDDQSLKMLDLGRAITEDIAAGYKNTLENQREIFKKFGEKITTTPINIGLSEKDLQHLKTAENLMQRFWKIPLILSIISLIVAGITSFLALNFYEKSVQGKEAFLSEQEKNGFILVNKNDYSGIEYNSRMTKKWIVENPKDSDKFLKWLQKQEQEKTNLKQK